MKVNSRSTQEDIHNQSNPMSCIQRLALPYRSGPFPIVPDQYIVFDSSKMNTWFATLRNTLIEAIDPVSQCEDGFISEEDFQLCCCYLVKARVDYVYSCCLGKRAANYIAIPHEFEIPTSLAIVINGIGKYEVMMGAFNVIPRPESQPAEASSALDKVVNESIFHSFRSLIGSAKRKELINTDFISLETHGNAWWLLSPRNPSDISTMARNSDSVIVQAMFKEWTPMDAMCASVVQTGFNGQLFHNNLIQHDPLEVGVNSTGIIPDAFMAWTSNPVRGIHSDRRAFNLNA
ncbi:hypothetical protein QAD02_005350 [Eretmocerus hayati]|uniref:Uncharacterized protein n=1 Tax=Eretmocerus hayati TaxID=131215 RepID=A0ACC2NTA9_9HYME|nr:hypothetical protein QAD02_005350 [Eretmocerus hayati]